MNDKAIADMIAATLKQRAADDLRATVLMSKPASAFTKDDAEFLGKHIAVVAKELGL